MSNDSDTDVRRLIAEAMAPLRKRIAELERRVAELETENAGLKAEKAALKSEVARLKKNSSNSSKPPSSDIVKPPKPLPPQGGQRKIGGQPGHEGHFRHSRSSAVLVEMLGKEFNGVLGCDYFSAYHKYMEDFGVAVQFCLAHLIRDVKFLTELPDQVTAAYGQRVLAGLRQLFHVIHRRETMAPARFQRALEKARDDLVATGKRAPPRPEAQTMAKRFKEHGADYFRFITTPGVAPTNNLAEQAIRFVVIDRLITQGTRSDRGRRWSERIWTAIATCAQQGRSVFEYLRQSIVASFNRTPAPSLLPAGA